MHKIYTTFMDKMYAFYARANLSIKFMHTLRAHFPTAHIKTGKYFLDLANLDLTG